MIELMKLIVEVILIDSKYHVIFVILRFFGVLCWLSFYKFSIFLVNWCKFMLVFILLFQYWGKLAVNTILLSVYTIYPNLSLTKYLLPDLILSIISWLLITSPKACRKTTASSYLNSGIRVPPYNVSFSIGC